MSWVNDLASASGIPAGAAILAMGMYGACNAAEKAARPEALQDIGRILKDPSWSRSVQPAAIIARVFEWTFGERHLSGKCVRRSALATFLFITAVCVSLYYRSGYFLYSKALDTPVEAGGDVLAAFFADYLALGKTRWLLRFQPGGSPLYLLLLDAALSLTISCTFLWVGMLFVHFVGSPAISMSQLTFMSTEIVLYNLHHLFVPNFGTITWYSPLMISTLLTSTWAAMFLIALTVIKVAPFLQRFSAWFFDVDNHPVQAIGVVSGALVMSGSLAWTVLRAVI